MKAEKNIFFSTLRLAPYRGCTSCANLSRMSFRVIVELLFAQHRFHVDAEASEAARAAAYLARTRTNVLVLRRNQAN